MKSILLSILLLSAGYCVAYLSQDPSAYYVLTAYVIIGFLTDPYNLVSGTFYKDLENEKHEYLIAKCMLNLMWIGVWIKMISLGFIVTGILGILWVVCSYLFIKSLGLRLKELKNERRS